MSALAVPAFHVDSAERTPADRTVMSAATTTKRAIAFGMLIASVDLNSFIGSFRLSGSQNVMDDVSADVGQAAGDAVVADGESLVIDAQQVQHRGMDVVAGRGAGAVGRFVTPFVAG